MSAATGLLILVEAARATARALHGLAESLEAAAVRAEAFLPSPAPCADWSGPPGASAPCEVGSAWGFVPEAAPTTPVARPSQAPLLGSPGSVSSATYGEVYYSFPELPEYCIGLCDRLTGTQASIKARAYRAWVAGCWAGQLWKAGSRNQLRPTPKSRLQNTIYVVLSQGSKRASAGTCVFFC